MFYVRFRSCRQGEWIKAETLLSAKWIFAKKHGLTSLAYIVGSRKS